MPHPKLLIATHNPGKLREYRGLLGNVPFELVSLVDLGISKEVEETGSTFHDNARLKASTYAALSGLLTLADDSGLEVDALGGEPGVLSARYGEKSTQPPLDKDKSPLTPLYERGVRRISDDKGRQRRMSDQDRVRLLLRNLEGVPWARRTARFRCVIAIAAPPSPPSARSGMGDHGPFILKVTGIQTPTACHSEERSDEESRGPCDQDDTEDKDFRPLAVARGDDEKAMPGVVALLVGSVAGMIQYEPIGQEGFGYDPVFYLPSYGLTMAQLSLAEKNRISHRANAAGKAAGILSGL